MKPMAAVKLFFFVMVHDMVLTHDVMRKRNINCALPRVIFRSCLVESTLHLFFLYPYAVSTGKSRLLQPVENNYNSECTTTFSFNTLKTKRKDYVAERVSQKLSAI